MEIALSNLGTINKMFTALFRFHFESRMGFLYYSQFVNWFFFWFVCSKLGVPIKTEMSANVLEETLNGTITIQPQPLGTLVSGKVCISLARIEAEKVYALISSTSIISSICSRVAKLQVEKQCAHFYGIKINKEAHLTIVFRITFSYSKQIKGDPFLFPFQNLLCCL